MDGRGDHYRIGTVVDNSEYSVTIEAVRFGLDMECGRLLYDSGEIEACRPAAANSPGYRGIEGRAATGQVA